MRDELAKIAWLKARFELNGDYEGAIIGIGDDAAVYDFGGTPTIITVDAHVEQTHFRSELLSFRQLGRRALTAAVSDVWAMGGEPAAAVVSLTLAPRFPETSFEALIDGLAEAARETNARIIGGNLTRGRELSIHTTVFGRPFGEALTRSGARPGDALYVTGTVGAAALGLELLQAGREETEGAAPFVERWRRPPNNAYAARKVSSLASAAIDVSDGCVQDARHLCGASEVGTTIRAEALPTLPGHAELCAILGLDPIELAAGGGEDYELLFAAPASPEADALGTRIGEIHEGTGVTLVDGSGQALSVARDGFDHFS